MSGVRAKLETAHNLIVQLQLRQNAAAVVLRGFQRKYQEYQSAYTNYASKLETLIDPEETIVSLLNRCCSLNPRQNRWMCACESCVKTRRNRGSNQKTKEKCRTQLCSVSRYVHSLIQDLLQVLYRQWVILFFLGFYLLTMCAGVQANEMRLIFHWSFRGQSPRST